jgi:hypothetical protein
VDGDAVEAWPCERGREAAERHPLGEEPNLAGADRITRGTVALSGVTKREAVRE